MEINLIPRKSFVQKYYFYFFILILLLLLAQAYLLITFYFDKQNEYLELKYDLQRIQTELALLEENRRWNVEVATHNTKVKEMRSYQGIVEGLQILEYDWSKELNDLRSILPKGNVSLNDYTISNNQLSGHGYFDSLSEVAQFMDQLQWSDSFTNVYISPISKQETAGMGYQVEFRFNIQPSYE